MSPTPRGWPRGVFSEKLGGGVRPTSQNPYSNYDQTGQNQLNWMLYLWPKRLKDHTLCASHTYMYKTHIREYSSPGHFSFVDIFLILFCFIINSLLCYRVFWNCYNFNFVWASRKMLTCLRCTFFVEEVQWALLRRFDVKRKVTFMITNTVCKAKTFWKLRFSKTLIKQQEFENAGFSLSREGKTFYKRNFSKTMTSRQSRDLPARVFLKHEPNMTVDGSVFKSQI